MLSWASSPLERDIGETESVNHIQYHARLLVKEDQSELDLFQDQEVQELLDNQKLKKFCNLQEFKTVIPVQEDALRQQVTVWRLCSQLWWIQQDSWLLIYGVALHLSKLHLKSSKFSLKQEFDFH